MINLLEETIGRKLLDSGLVNDFLKLYPTKPTSNRTKNKWVGLKTSIEQRKQDMVDGIGETISNP